MRAVQVQALEGPGALALADVPEPGLGHPMVPGPSVLIDVHVAGVSFPDLLLSQGRYQLKLEPPFVPGGEVAGVVVEASEGSGFQPGERVAGYSIAGGMAERTVAPAFLTFRLPEALSFAEGAGLILNPHTAYFSLVTRGRVTEGETVLVHGAAGGVGTATLQVARGLGARTIAVVSTDEKADFARSAGADEVLRSTGPWRDEARELTGGRGVDVVIDPVGGDRFTDSIRALAPAGRLVVVGFTEGSIPEMKVNRLLLNNVDVVGAGWGAWIMPRQDEGHAIGLEVNRLAEAGFVRPLVGASLPLERAADALRLLEGREALGKVVLEVR